MKHWATPFPLRTSILCLALLCQFAAKRSGLAAGPAAESFRVMTYNIHHGEGLDGKVDLERIAQLIRSEQADIVALQEVDKGVERTARRDFPRELAELTGMTCVFSNNLHHQGGEYGNAVLTRFPIKSVTNLHYRMVKPDEQRGLLQVRLEARGRELVLLDTHLDFQKDGVERLMKVDQIRSVLERDYPGKPAILCGDFNDTPGSRMHARLAEFLIDCWAAVGRGDGFTIPADHPRKRIDFIWLSKAAPIQPVQARIPSSQASDHLPVVVEFRWVD